MECANVLEKLRLDFAGGPRLRGAMPETDDDTRREIIPRLFYLVTVAAEDAAALGVEGQAAGLEQSRITDIAARLHALGETIEIISSAIEVFAHELRLG